MTLSEADKRRFFNLKKGIEGERKFDEQVQTIQNDILLLHDLCLEYQHSVFQLDMLIITEKGILLFEVKNYEGDYVYEADAFRLQASGQKILNPLHQLNRSLTLLSSLLESIDVQIPVKGYLTFVNDQFTLFQAPVEAPILLPTQLPRFIARVEQTPSILDGRHKELAAQLISRHLPDSGRGRLPKYDYNLLQKGILCSGCCTFMVRRSIQAVCCDTCGMTELVEKSILRSVGELGLLFPEKQITTAVVQEWCGIIDSPKTIRRALLQSYTPAGSRKYRHYVLKAKNM